MVARMPWANSVKVIGEVGFPTSLVWEDGRSIDDYVKRAGGYLRNADKGRARVVHPNGMSLPNKGSSKVIAGSTIIVPLKPPPEGRSTLEVARDITGIIAGPWGGPATTYFAFVVSERDGGSKVTIEDRTFLSGLLPCRRWGPGRNRDIRLRIATLPGEGL